MAFRQRISHELRAEVGPRLRTLRESRSISQAEIAFAAEVTQASISNYENGRNEIPLSVLLAVCDYLGVPLTEMLPMANLYAGPRREVAAPAPVAAAVGAAWSVPRAPNDGSDLYWPV